MYLLKSVPARVCVCPVCVCGQLTAKRLLVLSTLLVFFMFFFFWLFFELVRERVSFNIFLHVPALDATSKELPNIAKKNGQKGVEMGEGESEVKYTKKIRNARAKNVK